MSIEALAMAGADYSETGITFDPWGLEDTGPPPHLLLDEPISDDDDDDDDEEEEEIMMIVMKRKQSWHRTLLERGRAVAASAAKFLVGLHQLTQLHTSVFHGEIPFQFHENYLKIRDLGVHVLCCSNHQRMLKRSRV